LTFTATVARLLSLNLVFTFIFFCFLCFFEFKTIGMGRGRGALHPRRHQLACGLHPVMPHIPLFHIPPPCPAEQGAFPLAGLFLTFLLFYLPAMKIIHLSVAFFGNSATMKATFYTESFFGGAL